MRSLVELGDLRHSLKMAKNVNKKIVLKKLNVLKNDLFIYKMFNCTHYRGIHLKVHLAYLCHYLALT